MRQDIIQFLQRNPQLLQFVREQPHWYRVLTRDPTKAQQLNEAAKLYYGQTFSQKMNTFNQNLQMLSMLFQMLIMMGQSE